MQVASDTQDRETPEKLVGRLVAQLRNHALSDALLIFLPPVLAALYLLVVLHRAAWISETGFFLMTLSAAAAGMFAVIMRYRPLIPSVPSAARLIDEHARAEERFLTLATIEPSRCPASLLFRLRLEAAGFLDRIELKRDFPYRIKRSCYHSLIGSILVALLLQLLLPLAQSIVNPPPAHQRVRQLAEQLAQHPRFKELARDLQALAAKLEDSKLSQREQQTLIQDMQKKIEEQQNKQDQKDNRDLIGQAASTLKGMEEQAGKGQDQQKDQDKGGAIQSDLPQEGQGESKQSQGSGGESKGDLSAQQSKDIPQGKLSQGDPKEPGKDKNQQSQGDAKGNQPDRNQPGKDQSKEKAGKNQGESKDGGGKNQSAEEVPLGAPPAERFYQAGEQGKEGIKGARYVTVQLPEEVAADSKGESTATKETKGNRARPHVPVSNVPLPAHVPNAPTEKQPVPLEYRGIIR